MEAVSHEVDDWFVDSLMHLLTSTAWTLRAQQSTTGRHSR